MTIEEEMIKILKNPAERNDLGYLALDLITREYDILRIAGLAKQEGLPGQLGYLSEIIALALEKMGVSGSERLYRLSEILYENSLKWGYLNPNMPDFAKRIFCNGSQPKLNKKWKIWGTITPEEMEDWISLYGGKDIHGQEQKVELSRQTGSSVNY